MAYESPAALRQALETRLGNRSRETENAVHAWYKASNFSRNAW